jgi:hypothetical protein
MSDSSSQENKLLNINQLIINEDIDTAVDLYINLAPYFRRIFQNLRFTELHVLPKRILSL